ncbi:MAG TPA: MMPL family transporter, partial [Gaiellaceae bacterium]|nr:MMPL family transporter [Gaiellaceae bacterium]
MRSVGTIGRWSMQRPWRAVGAWLLFVVLAVAAGAAIGTESLENGAVGESGRGYALMDQHEAWPFAREYAYVRSESLKASDPSFKAALAVVSARMRAGLGSKPTEQTADGGHAVLLTGTVHRFDPGFRDSVLALGTAHPGVTIEETGDISASDARDRIEHRDLHRAELLSIPVTLFVLLFAFGAVVAALVPVLLALTAVAAALGLIGPISQVFAMDDAVKTVVVLIGMAVGVD